MNATAWAWLAGFIDGEGAIGIHRASDKRKGPNYHSFRATLQIVNTNRLALVQTLDIMELSSLNIAALRRDSTKWSPAFHINIRELHSLARILPQLMPYLIIKQHQAELTLEFVRSRLAQNGRGRRAPYTERERQLHILLKELNKRGPGKEERKQWTNQNNSLTLHPL